MAREHVPRRRAGFARRYLSRLLGPALLPPAPPGQSAGEESAQEEIRALKALIARQQAQIVDQRDELRRDREKADRARVLDAENRSGTRTVPWSSDEGAGDAHGELQRRLGCEVDADLTRAALTHRSYAFEHGGAAYNDRLTLLGNAVLGMLVTETLYRRQPNLFEKQLVTLRAAVVNSRAIGSVARGLELGRFVRLGRGEENSGGRDKAHILSDALEAIIGAVYLDRGPDAASALVHRLFDPLIATVSDV